MKRILALILSIAVLGSVAFTAFADEPVLISEEEQVVMEEVISDKMIVEGMVKEVTDEQIVLEDFALNIGEQTFVVDTELVPVEVKEGDLVTAVVSTMTTRSLPPQAFAFYVIVKKDAMDNAPMYMVVDEVADGKIISQDGRFEVTYENSEVAMYRTKNIVKAEELTKGSEIFVYADMMTMSIPALVNPTKIVVMSVAEPSKAEILNQLGVLLGTEKGLELEREVTRAEAVTLIWRTTPSNRMVYQSNFEDVPSTHWAYSNISWAYETKIVNGIGDNKFAPARGVTAKELAMMLLNATGETVEFEKAFEVACEKGFVTEEDGIMEDDVLTRDATAKMIYNYVNR